MFCPKCGANNLDAQRFCRGCGHGLVAHRLALEGKVEDAGAHVKGGSMLVSVGLIIIGIVKLNLILNLIFTTSTWGVFFNLLLLLFVAVPLVAAGIARIGRAKRALGQNDAGRDTAALKEDPPARLSAAPDTGAILDLPSVTEHTTFKLKEPTR